MTRTPWRTTINALLIFAFVLLCSTCARPSVSPAPDARMAADAIFSKYAAFLAAGDADGWSALWMEDGVQMPPDAPPNVGRSQIREKLRALLAQFRFDMHIQTQEVRSTADWAFARGLYQATLTPKAGGPAIPVDGKFLTILARQPDGSWRIYRDIFNSNVPPGR